MKKWANLCAVSAVLFLVAACGGGCAGQQVRRHVLLPEVQAAWQTIRVEALRERDARGIDVDLSQCDVAVQATAMGQLGNAPWGIADDLAEGDVARRLSEGVIGPAVAEIIRERNAQFVAARATLIAGGY